MTTITTTQIKERLSEGFNNVFTLERISSELPAKAAHSMTSAVLNFKGLSLVCGVYSLTDDVENGDYQRFVYIPETAQAFTF